MTHCLSCISHILKRLGPDVPSADIDSHYHGTFYWVYLSCYKKKYVRKTRTLTMKAQIYSFRKAIIWKALVSLTYQHQGELSRTAHPLGGVCVSSSWQSPVPSVLTLAFRLVSKSL